MVYAIQFGPFLIVATMLRVGNAGGSGNRRRKKLIRKWPSGRKRQNHHHFFFSSSSSSPSSSSSSSSSSWFSFDKMINARHQKANNKFVSNRIEINWIVMNPFKRREPERRIKRHNSVVNQAWLVTWFIPEWCWFQSS